MSAWGKDAATAGNLSLARKMIALSAVHSTCVGSTTMERTAQECKSSMEKIIADHTAHLESELLSAVNRKLCAAGRILPGEAIMRMPWGSGYMDYEFPDHAGRA